MVYNQDPAGKAMSSLRKDYAVIGKRHIRAWHIWLVVGVLAGAVGTVALVARNSAEEPLALKFGKSRAAGEILPIRNTIEVLSPNGGEILVTGQYAQVRWKSSGTQPTAIANISLLGSKDNTDHNEYILGQNVPNNGHFLFTVPVLAGGADGYYVVRVDAGFGSGAVDDSNTPFRVVSSINTPAISSVSPIYDTIKPGDILGISLLGVNFGDVPGILDFLVNGNVAASFHGSKPDSWTLAWSNNGIVLNILPSVTAGLAPGVYTMAARVSAPFGGGRGQQVYSNIVPFSFTGK